MTVRYYSSSAGKMVLQLGITAIATAMQVDTTAGLPGNVPFTLLVDVGLPTEEIVTVTQVSGNTLVVTRGEDGTSAQPHANGAVIRHAISARDLRDSRDHENAAAGVHRIIGNVVGTSDVQTLTNKNLTSGTNSFPATLATDANLQAEAAARLAADNAHAALTTAHGVAGAVVGTTDTQTLTGKTIDGATNTLVVPQAQVTNLPADLTALGGRVTVIEAKPLVLASATKAGKKTHWAAFSGTTNSGGVANFSHGAGFTPSIVHPVQYVVSGATTAFQVHYVSGSADGTTFQVQVFNGDGTARSSAITVGFTCFFGE